jgi:hypothetical protein
MGCLVVGGELTGLTGARTRVGVVAGFSEERALAIRPVGAARRGTFGVDNAFDRRTFV